MDAFLGEPHHNFLAGTKRLDAQDIADQDRPCIIGTVGWPMTTLSSAAISTLLSLVNLRSLEHRRPVVDRSARFSYCQRGWRVRCRRSTDPPARMARGILRRHGTAVRLGPGEVDVPGSEAAAAHDSAGMRCHELLALLFSDDEPATLASATKQAEAAALVGAEWVVFDATLRIRCGAACVVRFDPFLLSIGPSRTL